MIVINNINIFYYYLYIVYMNNDVRVKKIIWCYHILYLDENILFNNEDIKKSYKKLALLLHSDKNIGYQEIASTKFKELNEAYDILSNENERKWYHDYRKETSNKEEAKYNDIDDDKKYRAYHPCLYAYLLRNKKTQKLTAIKIGITSLVDKQDNIYKAIERRIKGEQIHNIKSEFGEIFEYDSVCFCSCLNEDDKEYDIKKYGKIRYQTGDIIYDGEYYKKRIEYYEKTIHGCLTGRGFNRQDMYTLSSLGEKKEKTEFFSMKNSKGECVKECID